MYEPINEPARTLYRAFQSEASKRPTRDVSVSLAEERRAVWSAARAYAQAHGLRIPTMQDVEITEWMAVGHTDYGAQWAYGLARRMTPPKEE